MNLATIKEYRELAEKHGHRSGKIILELCVEVENLKRMTLRKGLHPIGAEEPWPYEPYIGVPLAEVPEDHLIDWMKRQNRKGIKFDVEYAAVALRDLLLYDYIRKISTPIETGNDNPDTPSERSGTHVTEALPEAEVTI